MPETAECRLCGRPFRPRRGGGPLNYCARCGRKADREAVRVHRVRCKECGGTFHTPNRSVKYCSAPCRKKGYARRRRPARAPSAAAPGASAAAPPSRAKERTVKCRICGKAFLTDMRPGKPQVYCSPPCRAEGSRVRMREYMRRYLADPKRRAVHAARLRASSARRTARDARNRTRSIECAQCGGEFSTSNRSIRYCSDPCRKKARAIANAAYKRRRSGRDGSTPATARCRVCSKEFEAGRGGRGGLRIYCSHDCQVEGRRTYFREHKRKLRSRHGAGPGNRRRPARR